MWNLLCQYNNIYKTKKKVKTEDREKKNVATVATVLHGTVAIVKKKRQSGSPKLHCGWTVENIVWTVAKHYSDIAAFYKVNRYKKKRAQIDDWKKKKKSTYWTNQKYYSFYTFT